MARIAAVMPVTAVAMACASLLQDGRDSISRAEWESRLADLRFVLRGADAHVVGGDRSSADTLDRALVMLTLRHVVAPDGDRVPHRSRPGAAASLLRELHRAFPARAGARGAMTEPSAADERVESFTTDRRRHPARDADRRRAAAAWCSSRPASSCTETASSIACWPGAWPGSPTS